MSNECELFVKRVAECLSSKPRGRQKYALSRCVQRLVPMYSACWFRPVGLMYANKLSEASNVVDELLLDGDAVTRSQMEHAKELALDAEGAAAMNSMTTRGDVSMLAARGMRQFFELELDPELSADRCFLTCLSGLIAACMGDGGDMPPADLQILEWTLLYDIEGIHAENLPKPKSFIAAVNLWPFGKPSLWPSESMGFAAEVAIRAHSPILGVLRRLFG